MKKSRILFVMPALRTTDYTQLAYESFKLNSGDHDIRIGMDLDVEEDKEFYRKAGIPFEVFHGWGHWMMACYYVKQILDGKLDYDYVGLIHNDMVFGYDWLRPFDEYVENEKDNDNKLFCFNQENPQSNSGMFGHSIELFNAEMYQTYSKLVYSNEVRTDFYAFLPWVMSVGAFTTTFKWLTEGDTGIWTRRDYIPVQFQTRVWHFLNMAVRLHRGDYLNNQTTRNNWYRLARDPRYRDLLFYLHDNTLWCENKVFEELVSLSKEVLI